MRSFSINNFEFIFDSPEERVVCKPRFKVGDLYYGKETWAVDKLWDDKKPSEINPLVSVAYKTSPKMAWVGRWRSSMFMPEWASRIHRQITGVRCERLQAITEADVKAEGLGDGYTVMGWGYVYGQLWNKLNPKMNWDYNPWVFVYESKAVNQNG